MSCTHEPLSRGYRLQDGGDPVGGGIIVVSLIPNNAILQLLGIFPTKDRPTSE